MEYFLTAKFELDATNRKSAALMRVAKQAEYAYWIEMKKFQQKAEASILEADKKVRQKEYKVIQNQVSKNLTAADLSYVSSTVGDGIALDVQSSISSFVELRLKHHLNNYPSPLDDIVLPLNERLDAFASTIDLEPENIAKTDLLRRDKIKGVRTFTLTRSRDCRLIRKNDGRIFVALEILKSKRNTFPNGTKRTSLILSGYNASTGEIVEQKKTGTVLLVPVKCSKWHENKFLSGKSTLQSCKISFEDGKWYMHGQFKFIVDDMVMSSNVVGIDRGVVHPVAMSVVDGEGKIIGVEGLQGSNIGMIIKAFEKKSKKSQKRGKNPLKYVAKVDNALHVISNNIVGIAKKYNASVALEELKSLKKVIVRKRSFGARRNNLSKMLKKAQLGKLEALVEYKLKQVGLKKIKYVFANGTSIECSACANLDKMNRMSQSVFKCTQCEFETNADINASVVIARRGVMGFAKGNRNVLHKDMVAKLNNRGDSGIGLLVEFDQQVVIPHASEIMAYDSKVAKLENLP